MNERHRAFLLAAPSSGSGKTTLTLALLRILARTGAVVQPFKCGPDYLDTRLHALAASCGAYESKGINLDVFMASEAHVIELFRYHAGASDIAVVEGAMGLFDGSVKSAGSSAHIAKALDLPVIMVVDGRRMAYSAAPLLYGFRTFDPSLRVAGVIFNRVGKASHYRSLEAAARDAGVEPLGYVPSNEAIAIGERHLGLNTSLDYDREGIVEAMADHVERTVDIDRLLALAGTSRLAEGVTKRAPSFRSQSGRVIAVARDEAFNFLYEENLAVLQEHGEVVFFSPLDDERLPDASLLYLAGGYPELHAARLSDNTAMRQAVAAYCLSGGNAYAECGGLMYLGRALHTADGTTHPMCGVFDLETTMQEARLTLGYRKVRFENGYRGELRGHEFHYSRLEKSEKLTSVASVSDARDKLVPTAVFRTMNTLASYVHLYWGETRDFPGFLMEETW